MGGMTWHSGHLYGPSYALSRWGPPPEAWLAAGALGVGVGLAWLLWGGPTRAKVQPALVRGVGATGVGVSLLSLVDFNGAQAPDKAVLIFGLSLLSAATVPWFAERAGGRPGLGAWLLMPVLAFLGTSASDLSLMVHYWQAPLRGFEVSSLAIVGSSLLTRAELGLGGLGLGLLVPPLLQRRAMGPGDGVRLGLFGGACLCMAAGLESLRLVVVSPWSWGELPVADLAVGAGLLFLLATLAWVFWELLHRTARSQGTARRLRAAGLLEATVFATAVAAATTVSALPW